MGTRIEKDISLPPTAWRLPDIKTVKMFLASCRFSKTTPVPMADTIKVRARFRTRNIVRSLSPLVNNLFERRGSVGSYFERYTFEIMNPVTNMKDGVKNRRYR